MKQYPMLFKVSAQATSGISNNWEGHTPHLDHVLPVSIPPEFDGPGGGYSPEDIYAQALQNCFIATFKVFAEKSKLKFGEIHTAGTLYVDRNEKGFPWMARFHLEVKLTGVEQKENAQRLLEKTSQGCLILNSVKTEKSFDFQIA
jgi:organic hydroperoxide reductase OsmC/OhrA